MGLGINEDYPDLAPRKGDRIEPHSKMLDVGSSMALDTFPHRVLFWRTSAETHARHRNPLWSEKTGILPDRSAALDWLHVLSLGVFQTWCALAVHQLIACDAWGTLATTWEGKAALSCQRLTAETEAWQKRQEQAGRDVTRLG